MTVRYFTSRNDANHDNKHAIVDEKVEFFAFPYQPYSARVGDKGSHVSCYFEYPVGNMWIVKTYTCLPNGSTTKPKWGKFANKDEAFEFAAKELLADDNASL